MRDDFPAAAADAALVDLAPLPIHTLLVTGSPSRFEAWRSDRLETRIVLPKPAWAWTIADAIRARTADMRPKRGRRSR